MNEVEILKDISLEESIEQLKSFNPDSSPHPLIIELNNEPFKAETIKLLSSVLDYEVGLIKLKNGKRILQTGQRSHMTFRAIYNYYGKDSIEFKAHSHPSKISPLPSTADLKNMDPDSENGLITSDKLLIYSIPENALENVTFENILPRFMRDNYPDRYKDWFENNNWKSEDWNPIVEAFFLKYPSFLIHDEEYFISKFN